MKADLLIKMKCINGEGPVWDAANGQLVFIDVFGNCIYYSQNGEILKKISVPDNIGCAVPCENGSLAAGLLSGWYFVDPDTGRTEFICDPEPNPDTRCNDGKADPFGNLWIGHMSRKLDHDIGNAPAESGLYMRTPSGEMHTMLTGIYLGNGLAWNTEKHTFYYIDTVLQNVRSFHFDPDTLKLSDEKVVITIPEQLGSPDGMTIDEEGMLWIAMYGGFAVLRYDPESGRLLDRIDLPCPNVTCACFGGENMDELFITTGSQGTDTEKYPLAGSVFTAKVNVKGAPSYMYKV